MENLRLFSTPTADLKGLSHQFIEGWKWYDSTDLAWRGVTVVINSSNSLSFFNLNQSYRSLLAKGHRTLSTGYPLPDWTISLGIPIPCLKMQNIILITACKFIWTSSVCKRLLGNILQFSREKPPPFWRKKRKKVHKRTSNKNKTYNKHKTTKQTNHPNSKYTIIASQFIEKITCMWPTVSKFAFGLWTYN